MGIIDGVGKGDGSQLPREERERLAQIVTDMGKAGTDTFIERVARRMRQHGIQSPSVTVEYRNLSVEADAVMGSEAIPTIANVAAEGLKVGGRSFAYDLPWQIRWGESCRRREMP